MKKDVTSSRFTSSEAHKSNSNGESAASKVNKNANSQSLHNAPSAGKPEVQIEGMMIFIERSCSMQLLYLEQRLIPRFRGSHRFGKSQKEAAARRRRASAPSSKYACDQVRSVEHQHYEICLYSFFL